MRALPDGAVTIRLAEPDDLLALAKVHRTCWVETYRDLLPDSWFARHDEEWFVNLRRRWAETARPGTTEWVASTDEGLVGFAMSGPSFASETRPAPARELELYAIYVLSAWQGKRVGKALLDAAVGDAPCEVWVARDNPRAHAFYRRNGLVVDGAELVDPGLDDLPEVRMVR